MHSSVPLAAAHAVKVVYAANGILRLMTVAHMSPCSSSNSRDFPQFDNRLCTYGQPTHCSEWTIHAKLTMITDSLLIGKGMLMWLRTHQIATECDGLQSTRTHTSQSLTCSLLQIWYHCIHKVYPVWGIWCTYCYEVAAKDHPEIGEVQGTDGRLGELVGTQDPVLLQS